MKDSAKYAGIAYRALEDKKGEDIRILDISDINVFSVSPDPFQIVEEPVVT